MKKTLYVAILLLFALCNTAKAQSIMGKWYVHTKDSKKMEENTYLLIEFTPSNKVALTLYYEESVATAPGSTLKKKASVTGKFSMDGRAMSLAFDKNTIKTSLNLELSEEAKYIMKVLKTKKPREFNNAMAQLESAKAKELSKLKQLMIVQATMGAQIQILKFTDSEMRILEGDEFVSLTREQSAEHDECDTYSEISSASKSNANTNYQSLFLNYIHPIHISGFNPDYSNDEVFETVDIKPEAPNGLDDYITSNLQVPTTLVRKGFNENVKTSFIVRKDGRCTDVEVTECSEPTISSNLVKVLSKMPDWKPAKKDGRAVSYKRTMTIPIFIRENPNIIVRYQ